MRACAFVVGPHDGPGAALAHLARGLGFAAVSPFASLAAAEAQAQQTPLLFFLFAAVDDVLGLKATADAVRFSPSRRIRFSPMVYFSESPSLDAIRTCVEMGFDDVITLPFTSHRVSGRLDRLVDHTQVYFETADYLGPDPGMRLTHGQRNGQYRRLEIMRTVLSGVSVMRDEMQVAV